MTNFADTYSSEILSKEFLKKYANKEVKWGFGGLSYVVFKRSYARKLENGLTEEWPQTVARAINGLQKIGANYTKEEAEKLYDYIFNLKCSAAGRGLWQLGTTTVDRFGMNSLINCFFVTIKNIEDFCFLFDNLMLGAGVGFSLKREHIHELPKIKSGVNIVHQATKDADLILSDCRNGWIELLRRTLNSFFYTGKGFSYSSILIRGYGEPIKGFGGTASGPKILIEGIENICNVCKAREGKKLRSIDVLDICNIIGSIVVAGNVRRSSEIAIGDADDYLFLKAKRWDSGDIPNWRRMSNNTIAADDYNYISNSVWEGYHGNGEAYGFFNLDLSQNYGRLGDKVKDDVEGMNPCVTGDTKILIKGKSRAKKMRIDKLVGKKIQVWNGREWSEVEPRITGFDQPILKIKTSTGKSIKCTYTHSFILENDDRISAINLKIGDKLLETREIKSGTITSIEDYGISKVVYCFTEPKLHRGVFNGIITGQCGEVTLHSKECCNLAEIFLNNISSKEELLECAKLLYKGQKAIAAGKYLHEDTNHVVHKNMRLGLSVTGICQSKEKLEWLDETYKNLRKFDKEWSKKQGWNESIKLTTVKPSGTLSILSGSTPGVHPAYSKYYIRRIRLDGGDPLVKACREAGYHIEFEIGFDGSTNYKTVCIEFPCFSGDDVITAEQMTPIEQLELIKKMQTIWSDNAVSCSVYYKLEDLPKIKEWLSKNYNNSIKSVSFLLHQGHGYKQAPYEPITEEKYKETIKNIKPIKISNISDELLDNLECSSGACPVR